MTGDDDDDDNRCCLVHNEQAQQADAARRIRRRRRTFLQAAVTAAGRVFLCAISGYWIQIHRYTAAARVLTDIFSSRPRTHTRKQPRAHTSIHSCRHAADTRGSHVLEKLFFEAFPTYSCSARIQQIFFKVSANKIKQTTN